MHASRSKSASVTYFLGLKLW